MRRPLTRRGSPLAQCPSLRAALCVYGWRGVVCRTTTTVHYRSIPIATRGRQGQEQVLLHIRISADAKCPRHPLRQYQVVPAGCGVCQELLALKSCAETLERALRSAGRLGADLRWRNVRRGSKGSRADGSTAADAALAAVSTRAPDAPVAPGKALT